MARHALDLSAIAAADEQVEELGPLVARGRLRRLAPFYGVVAFALGSMFFDRVSDHRMFALVAGWAVFLALVILVLPWARWPRSAQGLVVLTWPVLIDVGMRTDGGVNSHLIGLMLVPLIWLALYEGRLLLFGGIAVAGVVLVVDDLQRGHGIDDTLRVLVVIVVAVAILPALRHVVTINRVALRAVSVMAERDPLTGLVNRRGFERRLRESQEDRSADHDVPGLGIVFVDVDHFKQINDRFGHDQGDAVLVEVGRRLLLSVRDVDVVGRLGGDEFVLACRGDRAAIDALVRRVGETLESWPFTVTGCPLQVRCSVGVSYARDPAADVSELLRAADRAMYDVKSRRAGPPVRAARMHRERRRSADV